MTGTRQGPPPGAVPVDRVHASRTLTPLDPWADGGPHVMGELGLGASPMAVQASPDERWALAAPALVVAGALAPVFPRGAVRRTPAVLPGVAHLASLEASDLVFAALGPFLRSRIGVGGPRLWTTFLQRYEGFTGQAMSTMGQRVLEMHDHVAELAKAGEQRVAACPLHMVSQTGRRVEGGIEIAFPITRANTADTTETTLHTVSRLLSDWEKDGIVRSTRKHIVVTQAHQPVLLSGAAG